MKIDGSTRSKTVLKWSLTRCSKSIAKDKRQHPEWVWDFAGMTACLKVEVKEEGQEKGRCFHKFSCVMGECPDCSKWDDITNMLERESDIQITYNVWG